MAKHKVITTDAELDQALKVAQELQAEPRVTGVEYKSGPGLDLLILKLSDGHRRLIPREDVEGLQEATPKQVAEMEILGKGTGLHWPALNLDHYVPRRSPRPRAFQRGTGNEGDGTLLRAEEDFCRLATSPLLRLSEPRSVGSGLPTETI